MRDRIQSGGCSGGGATSCAQSDADRGVWKTGSLCAKWDEEVGEDGVSAGMASGGGKSALR